MMQNIVMWGEVGTDQKVLLAIKLKEEENKVHIFGFQKEKVTKEIQDKLFSEWKNGGEFDFPEGIYHWIVPASNDNILPDDVRVDRPEIIVSAQAAWGKKLMSTRLNEVLVEEINLIDQKLQNINDFDQQLWDKTKDLWAKISDYRKQGELSWEHTDVLKGRINEIFDGIKALKRIDVEQADEESGHHFRNFIKKIEEQTSKLIYPDEWEKVFNTLKAIQNEVKDFNFSWKQKRVLFDKLNDTFLELRKYRKTEFINKTKDRIRNLKTTISGIVQSAERDKENYQAQFDKLMHYTRGKLSETEMAQRLGFIVDRIKEKEAKISNIGQTIQDLLKQVEKEEKNREELVNQPVENKQKKPKDQQVAKPTQEEKREKEATENNVAVEKEDISNVEVSKEVVELVSEQENQVNSDLEEAKEVKNETNNTTEEEVLNVEAAQEQEEKITEDVENKVEKSEQ